MNTIKTLFKNLSFKHLWSNLLFLISGCAVIATSINFEAIRLSILISGLLFIPLLIISFYFTSINNFFKQQVSWKIIVVAILLAFFSAVPFYYTNVDSNKITQLLSILSLSIKNNTFLIILTIIGGIFSFYFLSICLCLAKNIFKLEKKDNLFVKNQTKYYDWLFLAIVIAAVVIIGIVYLLQKTTWHVDEHYTFGLANSFFKPFLDDKSDVGGFIYTSLDVHNYLYADDNPFSYFSVVYNQINDVHPPLYYFFIHTLCSIFPFMSLEAVGFTVNAIFIVGTILLMFFWLKRNFSRFSTYAIILCYALSTSVFSTLTFFRMYAMLTFFTFLLTSSVYDIYKNNGRYKYLRFSLALIFGALTQYYFLIYAFVICLTCLIILYTTKRKSEFCQFFEIIVISASLYYSVWGIATIKHLLLDYRGVEATSAGFSFSSVFAMFKVYFEQVTQNKYLFICLVALLFASIVFFVIISVKKKIRFNVIPLLVICLPVVLYVLIVGNIAPAQVDRYIFNVVPCFWICFWLTLEKIFSFDNMLQFNKGISAKLIKQIALICTTLAIVIVGCFGTPKYLYKNTEPIAEYFNSLPSNSVCVYYEDQRYVGGFGYFQELYVNIEYNYLVNNSLEWLYENKEDITKNGEIVLIIQEWGEREKILSDVMTTLNFTNYELIGAISSSDVAVTSSVYKLTK